MISETIQQADSTTPMPVTQAVSTWWDVLRLYVFPALGTLLTGVVVLLLEWIRRVATQTSARTLVAAAHAQSAAKDAKEGRELLATEAQKHWTRLEEIKGETHEIHELVNSNAEKAQRQIDALSDQLRSVGERPEKGT